MNIVLSNLYYYSNMHLHIVMCFLLCINRNMEDVDTGVKVTTICEDLHTFKKVYLLFQILLLFITARSRVSFMSINKVGVASG